MPVRADCIRSPSPALDLRQEIFTGAGSVLNTLKKSVRQSVLCRQNVDSFVVHLFDNSGIDAKELAMLRME